MSKEFDEFMDGVKNNHPQNGESVFNCKIPNCPHCLEDIAQMEDDDLTDDEWLIKELKKELSTCIVCDEEKQTHVICMDCIVKTNHEISDEEIYKASREHITDGGGAQGWIQAAFRQGAVWYREQLRFKQGDDK